MQKKKKKSKEILPGTLLRMQENIFLRGWAKQQWVGQSQCLWLLSRLRHIYTWRKWKTDCSLSFLLLLFLTLQPRSFTLLRNFSLLPYFIFYDDCSVTWEISQPHVQIEGLSQYTDRINYDLIFLSTFITYWFNTVHFKRLIFISVFIRKSGFFPIKEKLKMASIAKQHTRTSVTKL